MTHAPNFHQLASGRWIYAQWSARNAQWVSWDIPVSVRRHVTGYRYTYAPTLTALAREARTYPSRTAARASIWRQVRRDEHRDRAL